jgi:outer membrane protein assembly factor BamB
MWKFVAKHYLYVGEYTHFSSSPIVYMSKVFIGSSTNQTIYCLDEFTGTLVSVMDLHSERKHNSNYRSETYWHHNLVRG